MWDRQPRDICQTKFSLILAASLVTSATSASPSPSPCLLLFTIGALPGVPAPRLSIATGVAPSICSTFPATVPGWRGHRRPGQAQRGRRRCSRRSTPPRGRRGQSTPPRPCSCRLAVARRCWKRSMVAERHGSKGVAAWRNPSRLLLVFIFSNQIDCTHQCSHESVCVFLATLISVESDGMHQDCRRRRAEIAIDTSLSIN